MVVSWSKSFGYFWANRLENTSWIVVEPLDSSGKFDHQRDWRYIKIKFFGRLAQLVRAFGLHPKCRWFESGSAHHLDFLDSNIL